MPSGYTVGAIFGFVTVLFSNGVRAPKPGCVCCMVVACFCKLSMFLSMFLIPTCAGAESAADEGALGALHRRRPRRVVRERAGGVHRANGARNRGETYDARGDEQGLQSAKHGRQGSQACNTRVRARMRLPADSSLCQECLEHPTLLVVHCFSYDRAALACCQAALVPCACRSALFTQRNGLLACFRKCGVHACENASDATCC